MACKWQMLCYSAAQRTNQTRISVPLASPILCYMVQIFAWGTLLKETFDLRGPVGAKIVVVAVVIALDMPICRCLMLSATTNFVTTNESLS